MNKFLLPILFLFCSVAHAQVGNDSAFELKELPASVTGQWKFHAGDNPVWADTAFNDSGWMHVDPTQYRHLVPEVTSAQLGWFRLKLQVAPAFRGKVVALIINQYGAAEIYFNGLLMRTMGHVSANYIDEQTRRSVTEPLTIQLSNAPLQYVAVRYSFNKANGIIGYGSPIILASFGQPDSAWDRFFLQVDRYTTRALVSGCFLLLAILQLAIYFFNRERKINLYLSIYASLQLFTLWDGVLQPIFPSANWNVFFETIFNISAPSEFVFLLAMTCDFFGYKRGWWFYTLAALSIPVIITQFIADNAQNEQILAIYNGVAYITIIVISAKAISQKKIGAILFLAGIIISLIFFTLFNIGYFIFHQPVLLIWFEVALAFLTPAIILAILLAGEFAHNLVSLRQKLVELESLSARSLQQEVEKQQILARQNETLEQKVTERTIELNQSLTDLKATQRQLIQSEKMASLGELTAGIAHEIQNPLNFVNNFSEVSVELLGELKEEAAGGHIDDVITIADGLVQNLEKIRHHGKRADSIVKGMLEHSRAPTGQKEATDLNILADEYLRLAYHGLRAKDKSFNAELITKFDEKLPLVNVIPQDIGRVLLNIFNNAFYAVNQKRRTADGDYKPVIEIETFFLPLLAGSPNGQGVGGLKVRDNGVGIPHAIKEKIMQPFFTTKPTGEGTGLGLSLSYDIVVKGHGGQIELNSKEAEYTEFVVTLPLNQNG